MEQLLMHLIGDYILQSDWMAQNKTKRYLPAVIHALLYTAVFLLLTRSWKALLVIFVTHLFIDRYRLARYLVWAKNWLGAWFQPVDIKLTGIDVTSRHWRFKQPIPDFKECANTGYPPDLPVWLAVWLVIIADNTLHLITNYCSLRWL